MELSFVTDNVVNVLIRSKFTAERTSIPNDHEIAKSLGNEQDLRTIADVLGINFDETKTTYSVVLLDGGAKKRVYAASVMAENGVPCVVWGSVKQPLTLLSKQVEWTVEWDKSFYIEFNTEIPVDPEETQILTFSLPLLLNKTAQENKVDKNTLRTAKKQGKLGDYLAASFVKARKLSELAPGEYEVMRYAIRYFKNEPKFEIFIKGHNTPYNANTDLKKALLKEPIISATSPAILEVGEVTRYTDAGYPIVPVLLTTESDKSIPVFDFSELAEDSTLSYSL